MYENFFKDSNILITGGAGFIGSALARRLLELGSNITIVDSMVPLYGGNLENIADIRDKIWFNIADVRDQYSMKHLIKDKNYVFNLAGQTSHVDSMSDPFTDLDINAKAQLKILEAVRQFNPNARIVYASTRQLYGRPQYLPVDEDHPIVPVDVNGVNKLAGEWYHLIYGNVYGIPCSCLRLTNTYGPGMRVKDARQTFLGIWVKSVLNGQPIKVFGDGEQLRDFNYVSDVVEAFLLTATTGSAIGQVFNLGSNEVISLKNLAKTIIQINGEGKIDIVPFPPERKLIDIGDYYSDWSKAKDILGWSPKIGLEEGIKYTLDFYRRHGAKYWEEDS